MEPLGGRCRSQPGILPGNAALRVEVLFEGDVLTWPVQFPCVAYIIIHTHRPLTLQLFNFPRSSLSLHAIPSP